jgi:hypothetical protein
VKISADGIYQDLKQLADVLYVEDWTVAGISSDKKYCD